MFKNLFSSDHNDTNLLPYELICAQEHSCPSYHGALRGALRDPRVRRRLDPTPTFAFSNALFFVEKKARAPPCRQASSARRSPI